MGRSGPPAENAVAESFVATLQTELLDRHRWPTRNGIRTAIFEFIEVFYNRQRRHSHLGYLSPVEFERRWYEELAKGYVGVVACTVEPWSRGAVEPWSRGAPGRVVPSRWLRLRRGQSSGEGSGTSESVGVVARGPSPMRSWSP